VNSIRDWLIEGEAALSHAGIVQPRLDARLLLQHVLSRSHAAMLSGLNDSVSAEQAARYHAMIERRAGGEPVSRITGMREFYGLSLKVTPAVLDPRPETELIVDRVLADVAAKNAALRFADIGTGSGAIALALLANLPNAACEALDISPEALAVARQNATALGFEKRFQGKLSDYLSAASGTYDFIVSNPPYIAATEIAGLDREVRDHDPVLALDGGSDGLDAYRSILGVAASHLNAGGRLYLEIGAGQRHDVELLAARHGWTVEGVHADLAGIDRTLVVRRGGQRA
jgi:release factor glutamine methyltransferase